MQFDQSNKASKKPSPEAGADPAEQAPGKDAASKGGPAAAPEQSVAATSGAKLRGRIIAASTKRAEAAASKSAAPAPASASSTDEKAPAAVTPEVPEAVADKSPERPFAYVCAFLVITGLCLFGVWQGNRKFAPEMYHSSGPIAFAEAFDRGENFATFDLNINIREMRNEQISRFKKTPEVAVLGASHWQEAHVELLPEMDFYNAHVHRDYYEDMPAVVEMFERHNRLPRKLIIAIRDRLFTPVADRTDFLWLPGIPYYEAIAPRLGIKAHAYWETAPVQRWREMASVRMLYSNVLRWYKAPVKPHATKKDHFETLDVLLPGGSIHWSGQHNRLFTQERSRRLATEFANQNFASPPKIDPKGIETMDRLLAYLKKKNVEVAFVHPPFNPIYYDRVKNGAYRTGLARIEKITQNFAKKYGFKVFGSFDPAQVGCTKEMYIDAEHANSACLGKIFKQYSALVAGEKPATTEEPALVAAVDFEEEMPSLLTLKRVARAAATAPVAVGNAAAPQVASVRLPPLPSQRPVFLPPLPSRNPLSATVFCTPQGPLSRHSFLFAPSSRRTQFNPRLTSLAPAKSERPL